MHPTARLSVSPRTQGRRVLQSFRANKDFYKGNRQSALPGGHRTGAPGVHLNSRPGYRLLEDRVRVFVAPPIDDILNSKLKPYVAPRVWISHKDKDGVFHGMPDSGLTPAHFLASARRFHEAQAKARAMSPPASTSTPPSSTATPQETVAP